MESYNGHLVLCKWSVVLVILSLPPLLHLKTMLPVRDIMAWLFVSDRLLLGVLSFSQPTCWTRVLFAQHGEVHLLSGYHKSVPRQHEEAVDHIPSS